MPMIGGGGTVGTGFVKIKPDTEGFGNELERGVGNEASRRSGAIGGAASAAFKGAFVGGIAAIGKGVFDFAGFDQGMREVFTLMPDISGAAMDTMTAQVKDFSSEFGVLPTETVPALYEALGAGVPPGNVFDFLETAQKLAKGGVTDLAVAVDGLSSVTNAYGLDVITATQASDIMFETVKLGKGTVDEVASSLFNVTPVAAAFGVTFADVGAALAVLTAQGTPVREATTQISRVIAELGKDGTKASNVFQEMSGKTFTDFIAEGGNLSDALKIMDQAAVDGGLSLVDMFGSIEAGQAALGLAKGDFAGFDSALVAMGDSAGGTEEAFETMNVGLAATMDRLKARFSVSLLNLGESLAPTIMVVGEAVASLLDLFTALPAPLQTGIILFATMTAGALAFAGPILKLIKLGGAMSKVFTLLAANPWMLAALALIAVGYLIVRNWEDIVAALGAAWEWIQATAGALASWFTETWTAVTTTVMAAFDTLTQFFVDYWPYILGIFTFGLGAVVGLIVQHWDQIWGKTIETWAAVTGVVSGAWSSILGIVTSVGGAVVGFIVGIPNAIMGAFTGLAAMISAPFIAAFNAIKSAWNNTVGGFGFTTPSWIPAIGGNTFNIPSMAGGGVAFEPMIARIGDAGRGNPEIVAPQNMMRETVAAALVDAGGGGGDVYNYSIVGIGSVSAEVRDPAFFDKYGTEIARSVQREIESQRRAQGSDTRGIAA